MSAAQSNTSTAGTTVSEFDLSRLWSICLNGWRAIALTTAITAIIALGYAFLATPSYRATAKIVIDPRPQRILALEEVLPGLTSDASAIETQVQLLTSGRIAQRVLRETGKRNPADTEGFTDLEIQNFLSHLTVARRGLTYVVDVSYTASDPAQAADIANRVARGYIAEETQSTIDATQRANIWLQERIKSLAPEVMALEKTIQQFRSLNNLIAIGDQTVGELNLINYMGQLGLARAALAEAEAKLEIDRSKSNVSLQSLDVFETAKAKVTLMEHGLSALTSELVKSRLRTIELQNLEREAAASKSLYESLLKRQKETEAQQNLSTVNARLAEEALPPAYPSWPRKSLLLAMGLILGFTIGVLRLVAGALLSRRD